jgi:hypothetical protein
MQPKVNPTAENPSPSFITAGKEISNIDVRISYRIIELFSEGLYRSPHKAIEELVCNAFDAGATKTHVVISPDLGSKDATIAVIDNGTGMNKEGLEQHWLVGVTNKREEGRQYPRGRKQIGKFGIGKLATYVLANCLTHVCKFDGKYYATTMDFSKIPSGRVEGIQTEKVQLPLRQLTETEAKTALLPWLNGKKSGYTEIKLFGQGAEKSWTVAIMSHLKEMATLIQRGRLRWIMATAMPLRDDFKLYLNGDQVPPSKLRGRKYGKWVLGRDLIKIPKPAPDELQATEDETQEKDSPYRFGLTHPRLGRITGYAELYEDLLTGSKSEEAGRSNGFFVYLYERLVNADDEYFGIDSNLLRHGTFARFRMVVHIDRLDEELRSSRETVREGPLTETARNILHGVFNYVRTKHEIAEAEQAPGKYAASRISASPASLTRRPLVGLVSLALSGDYSPMYVSYPRNLSPKQQSEFIDDFKRRAESPEGLVREVKLENLSQSQGIAVFDAGTGALQVNALHPYVAYFLDEYGHKTRNDPLELLAMSEVLLEAHLLELGVNATNVQDILSQRDELLRYLSRSVGKRNASLVAQALEDASANETLLEVELSAAFESLGFAVTRIGGSGKPDGLAEAHLSATKGGKAQSYKVTFEAKSKEKIGTKVSAKAVGVAGVARHRDDFKADYAAVVGPDFPTAGGECTALSKEIKANRTKNPGKGITLIRIGDMARLVRLVPAKLIGLNRLRELFETCSLPEEAKAWVDKLEAEKMKIPPYKELLDVISKEQSAMPQQAVEYGHVQTRLRLEKNIILEKEEITDLCKSLSKMVPSYVFARNNTVEITQRPDKILEAIRSIIREYPEKEQKTIAKPEQGENARY